MKDRVVLNDSRAFTFYSMDLIVRCYNRITTIVLSKMGRFRMVTNEMMPTSRVHKIASPIFFACHFRSFSHVTLVSSTKFLNMPYTTALVAFKLLLVRST